jgi:hypothetical protein
MTTVEKVFAADERGIWTVVNKSAEPPSWIFDRDSTLIMLKVSLQFVTLIS